MMGTRARKICLGKETTKGRSEWQGALVISTKWTKEKHEIVFTNMEMWATATSGLTGGMGTKARESGIEVKYLARINFPYLNLQ